MFKYWHANQFRDPRNNVHSQADREHDRSTCEQLLRATETEE